MEPFFDVCILTNGRSSFDFCKKSLEQQSIQPNIHVIENKSMVQAMNHIVNCDYMKRFVLKADDDFIFHSRAIEYFCQQSKWSNNTIMRWWHLWDVALSRNIQSVKIYDRNLCREMGPFKPDNSGRVDLKFLAAARNKGFACKSDQSVIAVHACNSREDQIEYEKLWIRNAPGRKHNKIGRNKILNCTTSLEKQFHKRDRLVETANKSPVYSFSKFLKSKQ